MRLVRKRITILDNFALPFLDRQGVELRSTRETNGRLPSTSMAHWGGASPVGQRRAVKFRIWKAKSFARSLTKHIKVGWVFTQSGVDTSVREMTCWGGADGSSFVG